MATNWLFNALLILVAIVVFVFLVLPRLRKNELWQATLTPLSSIIGSGFLVMAPLLASIVGKHATYAVTGIVFVAYALGYVMRYNIRNVESPNLDSEAHKVFQVPEYLGNLVLVVAYVIAVAFYLSLLSDFLLNFLGVNNLVWERLFTSLVIVFIAIVGYKRGLTGLERLESYSMTIQLSVVAALILGLCLFNFSVDEELTFARENLPLLVQIQMLAGVLLVVQGFETSRFLGDKYSPQVRVNSMRIAQWISGVIYIVSVFLLLPVLTNIDLFNIELSSIISAMVPVAFVLPAMLMLAALMSQFSAAVADTSGGGGLLRENSQNVLSSKVGYVVVSVSAAMLVWSVDLFGIIALASKAFAAYYFVQTVLALIHNTREGMFRSATAVGRQVLFVVLALILGFVVIFSIPAEEEDTEHRVDITVELDNDEPKLRKSYEITARGYDGES